MACCWVARQNQLSAESSARRRRCKVQSVCVMCAAALALHASPLESATSQPAIAACVLLLRTAPSACCACVQHYCVQVRGTPQFVLAAGAEWLKVLLHAQPMQLAWLMHDRFVAP